MGAQAKEREVVMNISLFRKNWVIVLIAIPAVIILLEASIRLYLFLNPEIVRLTELQEQTQKAFEDYAKTVTTAGEEKKLSELTPFEWDTVFFTGGYTTGLAELKRAISNGEVSLNLDGYTVMDEHFLDGEGFVFVSTKEDFLLSVRTRIPLNSSGLFMDFKKACILSKQGPHGNIYFTQQNCSKSGANHVN